MNHLLVSLSLPSLFMMNAWVDGSSSFILQFLTNDVMILNE